MSIPINHRVVLVVGPTTSGKSTMSRKIRDGFSGTSVIVSHDEVLLGVNQNQPQNVIDLEFRLQYLNRIQEAVSNQKNQLIIIDSFNIGSQNLQAVLLFLQLLGYHDKVTLLKTDLPFSLHTEFCMKRDDLQFRLNTTRNELYLTMISQNEFYHGPLGSLCESFLGTEEFRIEDPRDLEFVYSISENKVDKNSQKTIK